MVERIIAVANHFSGIFLFIIASSSYACWVGVRRIHSELECLHEDHDRVTHAHDILHAERQAALDSKLASKLGEK